MIELFIAIYVLTIFTGISLGIYGIYSDRLDTWGELTACVVWSAIPVIGSVFMGILLMELVSNAKFWNKPIKKARK